MLIIITASVFLIVSLVIAAFGYKYYARPSRVLEQLSTPAPTADTYTSISVQTPPTTRGDFQVKSALMWLGEKLPVNPQDASITRRLLAAAGFRNDSALTIYNGVRIGSAILGASLAAVSTALTSYAPLVDLLFIVGAAGIGWWLPSLILQEVLISGYQERLRLALPDALDMLVICVESGISLDQAMRIVSDELALTHPDLCREFKLVSVEMRAGLRRGQALKNLADRTMEPELSKLVAMLIQTDRFGTSIGDALRTHSDFMRVKRRQIAEEKAGKLSVKLIFPVFFLIMPAIFLVTVGPAIMSIASSSLFSS